MPVLRSRLFTWNTKLRMGAEIFRNPAALPDRSVVRLCRRSFRPGGRRLPRRASACGRLRRLPRQTSAPPSVLPKFVEYEQRFGSVVVGALREKRKPSAGQSIFKTLRNGHGRPDRRARTAHARIVPSTRSRRSNGLTGWRVLAAGEWHEFDQRRPLLRRQPRRAAAAVGRRTGLPLCSTSIPYTGSAIWTFGYRREDIPHPLDAFGFLVPRPSAARLWPAPGWQPSGEGASPADKAVFAAFQPTSDVSREAVQDDLRRLMGIAAEPLFAVHHRWPDSMPQYTVGHAHASRNSSARATIPGLHLAGNAYHGVGLPDCVVSAQAAVSAVMRSRL